MRLRVVAGFLVLVAAASSACGALLPTSDDDRPSPSSLDSGSDATGDEVATAEGGALAPIDPTAEPPDAAVGDGAADADATRPVGLAWQCTFEPSDTYAGLSECEAQRRADCEEVPDGGSAGACTSSGDTVTTCTGCNAFYRFYKKTCTCN